MPPPMVTKSLRKRQAFISTSALALLRTLQPWVLGFLVVLGNILVILVYQGIKSIWFP